MQILYGSKDLYLAFEHESTMRKWENLLKQCVGYSKFLEGKLNQYYQTKQQQKAHKMIMETMMAMANKEISIMDLHPIDD